MLSFAIALAAGFSPLPLTPDQQQRIRCVALLAIVAGEQERRTAAALELPPLARQGPRFAQIVGDAVVKESGRSQEQVRALILEQVAATQKAAGTSGALPVEDAKACLTVMNAVAPPLPPPSPVQCAGLLKLAADDVRRREGMNKTAMDLMTIASALDNRARAELTVAGRSGAESDADITLAREAISAKPETAPDLEAGVELAQP